MVETPELKIIISGQESDYTDTPLIIDSRTMLPLREVLTNLGVQNDDEHIIWDGDTKTVTVITEDKTVILQVGSEKAYVNREEVILDVVPVLYDKNWRTYIPARFVSEALDRKVVWDGGNRAVMISYEETYNKVFEILTKCEEANEIVACGLDIKEGGDEGLIILEGNALFDELINQSLIGSMTDADETNNIDIGSYYIELAIDKDTYEVVYFEFNLKAESMDSSGSTISMNMDMSMTYSDLNGNFDIEVPQDVLDAAVESVDVIEIEIDQ